MRTYLREIVKMTLLILKCEGFFCFLGVVCGIIFLFLCKLSQIDHTRHMLSALITLCCV